MFRKSCFRTSRSTLRNIGCLLTGAFLVILCNFGFNPGERNVKQIDHRFQQIESKSFPREPGKPCVYPELKNVDQFYAYGRKEKMACANLTEFGDKGSDGSKFGCIDDRFKIDPANCIALSFGIEDNWEFDDAMDKLGCTVYAFDPTLGKDDFNRSSRIHFFNLGISDVREVDKGNRTRKIYMDTYAGILATLGLLDRKIYYLKMDVEGYEYNFFNEVFKDSSHLLKNVKQIGMEIHNGSPPKDSEATDPEALKKRRYSGLWNGMMQLECLGFQLLHYEKNTYPVNHYQWKNTTESHCYEVVWARV